VFAQSSNRIEPLEKETEMKSTGNPLFVQKPFSVRVYQPRQEQCPLVSVLTEPDSPELLRTAPRFDLRHFDNELALWEYLDWASKNGDTLTPDDIPGMRAALDAEQWKAGVSRQRAVSKCFDPPLCSDGTEFDGVGCSTDRSAGHRTQFQPNTQVDASDSEARLKLCQETAVRDLRGHMLPDAATHSYQRTRYSVVPEQFGKGIAGEPGIVVTGGGELWCYPHIRMGNEAEFMLRARPGDRHHEHGYVNALTGGNDWSKSGLERDLLQLIDASKSGPTMAAICPCAEVFEHAIPISLDFDAPSVTSLDREIHLRVYAPDGEEVLQQDGKFSEFLRNPLHYVSFITARRSIPDGVWVYLGTPVVAEDGVEPGSIIKIWVDGLPPLFLTTVMAPHHPTDDAIRDFWEKDGAYEN
jgi:hypothetical protein